MWPHSPRTDPLVVYVVVMVSSVRAWWVVTVDVVTASRLLIIELFSSATAEAAWLTFLDSVRFVVTVLGKAIIGPDCRWQKVQGNLSYPIGEKMRVSDSRGVKMHPE